AVLNSRINSEAPERARGPLSLSDQRTRPHASSRRAGFLTAGPYGRPMTITSLSFVALRDEVGTAGSESRDGVSLAQGVGAAGEEDAEPVVGEVAVAAAGALDLLDEQVRRFDGAVAGAGVVVGDDLGPPPSQGLGETSQFGAGFGLGAPGDGVVDPFSGEVGVVGGVDRTVLLLGDTAVPNFVVGVAGVEGGVEALPAGFVDAFGAEEQQLADVIERITLPAPMLEGLLLDPLAAGGHGGVAEPDDVERVHDDGRVGEGTGPAGGVGVHHGGAVALVGVDRHDLDLVEPPRRHVGHPGP